MSPSAKSTIASTVLDQAHAFGAGDGARKQQSQHARIGYHQSPWKMGEMIAMLRSLIGAGLLVALGVTAAAAGDIAGTYTVTGKNPDGSEYTGVATIAGSAGGVCGITWTIGEGQTSQAFCMRQDEVVGAAYTLGDKIGLVLYRINAEGGLDGTWSIAGEEGVGEEHLTPQP